MKTIIAIDPGTTDSAILVWNEGIIYSSFAANEEVLRYARNPDNIEGGEMVVIEMVACYGMPVGREVFETCLVIGRLLEAFETHGIKCALVYRKDVKMHLCGTAKAKDSNIRQALIDKYGPCGTKSNPGKLYGISGHLWAALAVADYALSSPSELF